MTVSKVSTWFRRLIDVLSGDADRRTVFFVVDQGYMDRSWFARWYLRNGGCQLIETTSKNRYDMALELRLNLKVLFIDSREDFVYWQFLKDLKDGRVFSPKYEPTWKFYGPLHIVVFVKEDLDVSTLSSDGYRVIKFLRSTMIVS
jgi:hypothetical protein